MFCCCLGGDCCAGTLLCHSATRLPGRKMLLRILLPMNAKYARQRQNRLLGTRNFWRLRNFERWVRGNNMLFIAKWRAQSTISSCFCPLFHLVSSDVSANAVNCKGQAMTKIKIKCTTHIMLRTKTRTHRNFWFALCPLFLLDFLLPLRFGHAVWDSCTRVQTTCATPITISTFAILVEFFVGAGLVVTRQ